LLVALRPDDAAVVTRQLEAAGQTVAVIGEVVPKGDKPPRVELH
jgi:hypothetical protein